MIKTLKLLALFLSLSLAASAQKEVKENSLLWEISGNGLSKPSYIFGTYHFIGKAFIDTMQTVNAKLNAADAVVGELVMDTQEMMKLAPYMMLKGNSLDKILSPEEYQTVNAVVTAKLKTDLRAFNSFNPMAVQVMLLPSFSPIPVDLNGEVIDQYFQSYAKNKSIPVHGLETIEEQAKVLFSATIDRQKEMLLKFVGDTTKTKKQGEELYNAYIKQDAKALNNIFEKTEDYTQAEMDELVKNRNLRWIAKLPAMMKAESLFIAVGAGHLFGKYGVLKGLADMGYTIKPVPTK
jgi:uncharacterized protein YbaP (TraB family)